MNKNIKNFFENHKILAPFISWLVFAFLFFAFSLFMNLNVAVFLILFLISIGIMSGISAQLKGRSSFGWFFITIVFGFISFIVLAFLDDLNKANEKIIIDKK